MELVEGTKYARKCSITGEGINKGYCIGEGEDYAKDDAALQEHFKWKNDTEKKKSYDLGEYYWTEWEMPIEAQYIVKHGELVKFEENNEPVELWEEDITSQRIYQSKDGEVGVWAFVMANFPNYETSEDIAYVEDLRKIIEVEVIKEPGMVLDTKTQSLFEETFESDLNHVKREYNYMHAKVYSQAIQNFIKKPYISETTLREAYESGRNNPHKDESIEELMDFSKNRPEPKSFENWYSTHQMMQPKI